jgi:hypothetical protein
VLSFKYILNILILYYLGTTIFVWKPKYNTWSLMGEYSHALRAGFEVQWKEENDYWVLYLAAVSCLNIKNLQFSNLVIQIVNIWGADTSRASSVGSTVPSSVISSTHSCSSTRPETPGSAGSNMIASGSVRMLSGSTLANYLGITIPKFEQHLRSQYRRYLVVLEAIEAWNTADWSSYRKPTQTSVIELFLGSTYWYKSKAIFDAIQSYPEMVAWLEEQPSALPTRKFFGDKTNPSLDDLKGWFDKQKKKEDDVDSSEDSGTEKKVKKGKGKRTK